MANNEPIHDYPVPNGNPGDVPETEESGVILTASLETSGTGTDPSPSSGLPAGSDPSVA